MLNNTLTWKHPGKSTHNAKKQTDVWGWQWSGIISLAHSRAPKPPVAHGSELQTLRLLAELDELGCGSAANLGRPQSCAKPRLDLWLQTRDLLSGPRSSTRMQNRQRTKKKRSLANATKRKPELRRAAVLSFISPLTVTVLDGPVLSSLLSALSVVSVKPRIFSWHLQTVTPRETPK